MIRACAAPSPKTVCVPRSHRSQPLHLHAAACRFLIVSFDGRKGSALGKLSSRRSMWPLNLATFQMTSKPCPFCGPTSRLKSLNIVCIQARIICRKIQWSLYWIVRSFNVRSHGCDTSERIESNAGQLRERSLLKAITFVHGRPAFSI
jgi:hypothetical protein